jgi:hypothetical protein
MTNRIEDRLKQLGASSESAVGMNSLPFGVAVEIEAIFEFAA